MFRKALKKQARKCLKKHYILFAAVCLIGALIGTEFSGSINAFTSHYAEDTPYEIISSGRGIMMDKSFIDIVAELGREAGFKGYHETVKPEKKPEDDHPVFGTTRGVFAYIIDAVSSGSFVVTIFAALSSVIGSQSVVVGILVAAAFLVMFALWFFLQNMYTAVSRRMFLEGRLYEKVHAQRFLFFIRVKRWAKASFSMFMCTLLHILWSFTIVGAVIKRYSYYFVPYIVAENPDIGALEAITLSRKMMNGHKFECFVFELTFLGWDILSFFSLGITALLYSNPYKIATFSEYYAMLRGFYIDAGLEGSGYLNDRYLFEKPAVEVIDSAYSDVLELMKKPVETMDEVPGFRGFLARNFGVLLTHTPQERAYERSQAEQILINARRDAVEGRVYPDRLSPMGEKRDRVETSYYMRNYSVSSLISMFFLFSFAGWVWEIILHLIAEHELVNRGVLHGPWLPIYGAGGVMILVLLKRLRSKPAWEFTCAVVLCGLVEYFTSYFMELAHNGQRWWDYSGYFLNLNGRICGEGLLVFGLGGMLVVYLIAPQIDNFIRRVPGKILKPVCIVLLLIFVADQIYSMKVPNAGKGITEGVAPAAKMDAGYAEKYII